MTTPFDPATVIVPYQSMLARIVEEATTDIPHTPIKQADFILASVYLTILQSTIEAATLLREPTTITIGGVLRSILESYADLCALAKNPMYARRMLATLYDQRCRMFQDMLSNTANEYHASLGKQINPAAELAVSAKQLAAERTAGFHPLSNFDRLAEADLKNEYRSLYWQLCMESHNSIASIESRHIVDHNGIHSLVLAQDNHPGSMLKYYDSLISMLIESNLQLHSRTNSPGLPRWQTWQRDLREFRAAYIPTE
jgi:hypothetical protein